MSQSPGHGPWAHVSYLGVHQLFHDVVEGVFNYHPMILFISNPDARGALRGGGLLNPSTFWKVVVEEPLCGICGGGHQPSIKKNPKYIYIGGGYKVTFI